jgi:hypothetical protein
MVIHNIDMVILDVNLGYLVTLTLPRQLGLRHLAIDLLNPVVALALCPSVALFPSL